MVGNTGWGIVSVGEVKCPWGIGPVGNGAIIVRTDRGVHPYGILPMILPYTERAVEDAGPYAPAIDGAPPLALPLGEPRDATAAGIMRRGTWGPAIRFLCSPSGRTESSALAYFHRQKKNRHSAK